MSETMEQLRCQNAELRREIRALKEEIVRLKSEVEHVRRNQNKMIKGLENIEAHLVATPKLRKWLFSRG